MAGTESSLELVVERLLELGCSGAYRHKVDSVISSLKAVRYPKQLHIKALQMLAVESNAKSQGCH